MVRKDKWSFFKAAVLALYLLALLWLILFKCSFDIGSVFGYQSNELNVNPFADVSQGNVKQMIDNLVVFVPLGLLFCVNFKQSNFRQKLALVFLFSVAAEIFQFIFAIGTTDITDVIMNTAGGYLGLRLYDLSRIGEEKRDRVIAMGVMTLLAVFISLRMFVLKVNY